MTASGNNLPRSEGSALCAMVISIVSAILNIIIDPILIFGFDMGLKGAAYSTVIAQTIPGIYLMYWLISKSSVRLTLSNLLKPNIAKILEIILLGLGPCVIMASNALTGLIVNAVVCPLAKNGIDDPVEAEKAMNMYIAMFSVAIKMCGITIFTTVGYMQGFLTLQGYVNGAKEYHKAYIMKRFSQILCGSITLVSSLFVIGFSRSVMTAFVHRDDPDIDVDQFIETGSSILRIVCSFLTLYSLSLICATDFQSDGQLIPAALFAMGKYVILYTMLCVFAWGVDGVTIDFMWWMFPLSDIVSFIGVAITSEIRDCNVLSRMKKSHQTFKDIEVFGSSCCARLTDVEEEIVLSESCPMEIIQERSRNSTPRV
eukprot:gnl/Carplike_NY0171/3075_a4130_577.p1 GENE.gnl/Carplike_NY0171/3075_a4130_577~~gnl/Carplike_NY0171/3075_a4130_577.p1  ORF type:complete len:371 (+),score=65.27 gnl/Carplike_NY0171/3075_a4130_577:631-1743(+)